MFSGLSDKKQKSGRWERLEETEREGTTAPIHHQGLVRVKKMRKEMSLHSLVPRWQQQIGRLDNGVLSLFSQESEGRQDQGAVQLHLAIITHIERNSRKNKFRFANSDGSCTLRINKNDFGSWERALQIHKQYGQRHVHNALVRSVSTAKSGRQIQRRRPINTKQIKRMNQVLYLAVDSLKQTICALDEMTNTLDTSERQLNQISVRPSSTIDKNQNSTRSIGSRSSATEISEPPRPKAKGRTRGKKFTNWRSCLPAKAPSRKALPLRLLHKQLTKEKVVHMPMRGEYNPLSMTHFEPLSILQKICFPLEHSSLLDHAALEDDPVNRMCLVVAFAFALPFNHYQQYKPFESCLGETYEFDRTSDLGWRYHSEKVSTGTHASFAEGRGWSWSRLFSYKIDCDLKLDRMTVNHGNQSDIQLIHFGENYAWDGLEIRLDEYSRPEATFISHQGTLHISSSNGVQCDLRVEPCATADDCCRAEGFVVVDGEQKAKVFGECSMAGKRFCRKAASEADGHVKFLLLEPDLRPYHNQYYGLTAFGLTLNQTCEGVPPTDSRLRKDTQLLEEGKWDQALQATNDLDMKEQQRIKKIKEKEIDYVPIYFKATQNSSGGAWWKSKGDYWTHKANKFINIPTPIDWIHF